MAVNIEAHITGTIFRIETEAGTQVSAGDVLLIIESMKMEMPVEAPGAGRVAEIRVEEGQSVEEGDLLVVLE
jgi:acetyl-CoA carboxylase biotin carboxyl carrier protein